MAFSKTTQNQFIKTHPLHDLSETELSISKKAISSWKEFPSPDLEREAPDAHWVLADEACNAMSRCSLWWSGTPLLNGEKTGFIGHYSAIDTASGAAILEHACAQLRKQGCRVAVGPIDGSTWRRYRLVTERSSEPTFLMEQDNPQEYPLHFSNAGFGTIAAYASGVNNNLLKAEPAVAGIRERLKQGGLKLRSLSVRDLTEELKSIFELCSIAFQGNYLYSPIQEDEFTQRYAWLIKHHINPELVIMAERHEKLVGFMLAFPNALEGHSPQSIVMKTVARMPGQELAGLGKVLFDETHRRAHELGYKRAIHAYVMDENRGSRPISDFYIERIRRYALFGRKI